MTTLAITWPKSNFHRSNGNSFPLERFYICPVGHRMIEWKHMKRKIFISLNIPNRDKKRLLRACEKWQDLPVKWTKLENLHLTVAFLGFVSEDSLFEISQKVDEATKKNKIFDIDFDRIGLFPSVSEPRAVAILGEASEELKNLVNDIEMTLGLSTVSKKTFRPHITLGRVRKTKWEALSEKPQIAENFHSNLEISSVDILASDFDGEGEYVVIESCPLS